jgi:hypothetical protein
MDKMHYFSKDFTLINGMEATIYCLNGKEAHLGCIGLKKHPLKYVASEKELFKITDDVKRLGGFPIINHPSPDSAFYKLDNIIDSLKHTTNPASAVGLEIFNPRPNREHVSFWDQLLSKNIAVWGVATDDTHFRYNVGHGWVVVRAGKNSPEDIVRAIKRGSFYASTGIILEDVSFDGNTIKVKAAPQFKTGNAFHLQHRDCEFFGKWEGTERFYKSIPYPSFVAKEKGATLSFDFSGSNVSLLLQTSNINLTGDAPELAIAYVEIDGSSSKANMLPVDSQGRAYISKSSHYICKIPIANNLPKGKHSIKVTIAGNSGIMGYNTGMTLKTFDGELFICGYEIETRRKSELLPQIKFIGRNGKVLKKENALESSYKVTGNEGYIRAEVEIGNNVINNNIFSARAWTQPILIYDKNNIYNPYSSSGKWLKGNIHCHATEYSKSGIWDVIENYKGKDYDFLVLTEHNSLSCGIEGKYPAMKKSLDDMTPCLQNDNNTVKCYPSSERFVIIDNYTMGDTHHIIPTLPTKLELYYSNSGLHFKFEAEEHALDNKIKFPSGKPWQGNCFEILLDSEHSHKSWHHFIFNADGSFYAAQVKWNGKEKDIALIQNDRLSSIELTTKRTDKILNMQFFIPFSILGATPKTNDEWGLCAMRNEFVLGERSIWPDMNAFFIHGVHMPWQFGHIVFCK